MLLPARNERVAGEASGPSYTTTAMIKARNRARAWLEEHFTIIPKTTPADTGWALGNQPLSL